MDARTLGETALTGWRARAAAGLAAPVARSTQLSEHYARTLVGLSFLALSARYVAGTLLRAARA